MKSIKPGRGPSMMGGVAGIFMIGFGIGWTVIVGSTFPLMALFGILWTGIAIAQTVYHFKNAKSKNRYSAFDIVDAEEEPDPLNERYGSASSRQSGSAPYQRPGTTSRFCPYCGRQAESEFDFCPGCGKQLPD